MRSELVDVLMKPTWIVAPSLAPDWKLNAGRVGFEAAATYWLTLMNEVTPTSRVPTVPNADRDAVDDGRGRPNRRRQRDGRDDRDRVARLRS